MTAPTTAGWLRTAAQRVCKGSAILTRKITKRGVGATRKRTGEWRGGISRWLGESNGTLDSVVRWAMLLIAAWLLWHLGSIPLHLAGRILSAARWMLWVATAWWVIAAYRAAGKPAAKDEQPDGAQETEADGDAPDDPPGAVAPKEFLELVRESLADARGVHLATLAATLTERYPARRWDIPAVRVLCAAAGVPVDRGVREPRRGVTVGVRRKDLPPPSSPPPGVPPVAVDSAGQPEQQQQQHPSATPARALSQEWPFNLVDDATNPHRTHVQWAQPDHQKAVK